MRIGPRITLTTSALVALTLGAYGAWAVATRRGELRTDLERQTRALGATVQVAMEAALREGLFEDVNRLVARLAARERPTELVVIDLDRGGGRTPPAPPPGPRRRERLGRVVITAEPYGELVRDGRGGLVYTYLVPLRDQGGVVVGAIDLVRDAGWIDADLRRTAGRMALTLVALVGGLVAAVRLSALRSIGRPIGKLVDGVRDVASGDLSHVLLAERDDEIGALAARFNEMTASLRAAREETRRSVEARLQLEARLRHSEKLATIGQLAAGIAHEVGTPLNVIGGRARAMDRKAHDPDEVHKNAEIIAAQAARITKIIQQLLDFARRRAPARGEVDLGQLARDSVELLEPELRARRVEARVEVAPEAPRVGGDPDQLQQVCLNLLLNGIQAMADGGLLEVRVLASSRRRPGLDVAPAQRFAVLEVVDRGVGIPPEDRERIFEPFYSTKADGEGTGLGLSVSHGIVKDHDGWIEIDAGAPRGTTFRVLLPADGAAPAAGEASA